MTRRPAPPPARRPAPAGRPAAAGPSGSSGSARGSVAAPPRTRPEPPPKVSSAQLRIEARLRRRRWRRVGLAALAAVAVAAAGWVVLGSPWLRATRVQVIGVHRLDAAQVRAAAAPELGRPLALAHTDDVAARVRAEPLVLGVLVRRSWPGTLRVEVTERTPVAAVRRADGIAVVDADGVVLGVDPTPPPGLPLVEVDPGTAREGTVAAVVDILAGLPRTLSAAVRRSGATSPDDVWLVLADGSRVIWGSADQPGLKATVLARLRSVRAAVYDVSAPGTPSISGSLASPGAKATGHRTPSARAKTGADAATARPRTAGTPSATGGGRTPRATAPPTTAAARATGAGKTGAGRVSAGAGGTGRPSPSATGRRTRG